jgi:hypothetical protein
MFPFATMWRSAFGVRPRYAAASSTVSSRGCSVWCSRARIRSAIASANASRPGFPVVSIRFLGSNLRSPCCARERRCAVFLGRGSPQCKTCRSLNRAAHLRGERCSQRHRRAGLFLAALRCSPASLLLTCQNRQHLVPRRGRGLRQSPGQLCSETFRYG